LTDWHADSSLKAVSQSAAPRRRFKNFPRLARVLLMPSRARSAFSYYRKPLQQIASWLFASREITNFTYDLQPDNKRYLAAFVSNLTGITFETAARYLAEIDQNEALSSHLRRAVDQSELSYLADNRLWPGRRMGWYMFARALKPRVVVETGVEKGLGACVLVEALKRNADEGNPGIYYGTDISPDAGYLFSGDYRRYGKILYGDSVTSLRLLTEEIDLFINDSDHSAEYEAAEYRTIESKLSAQALVVGDNAHCTTKLLEFALATGRSFSFFQEEPQNHWYPGAGIGVAFRR
jgi:hypothetical protein